MPSPRSLLTQIAVPAVFGALAGVTATFLLSGSNESEEEEDVLPQQAVRATVPDGEPDVVRGRTAVLSNDRIDLPDAGRGTTTAESPVGNEEPPPEDVDPETSRAFRLRDHEMRLHQHFSSPRDPSWAGATEDRLEMDILAVAEERDLGLISVDCRSNSCVATMEWSGHSEARREFGHLLTHAYAENCTTRIVLPEPGEDGVPYQASMFMECSDEEGGR